MIFKISIVIFGFFCYSICMKLYKNKNNVEGEQKNELF